MEELKQQIIDLCNESNLPLEALLFVTKDVWRDVEDTLRKLKEQTVYSQTQTTQEKDEEEKE